MSFQGDLRRFALNTKIRADLVLRKVTIDLTSDLVKMTPVDTGHARSNWFFGYQPVAGTSRSVDMTNYRKAKGLQSTFSVKEKAQAVKASAKDQNGAPSIQRSLEFAKDLKAGGIFFISNNVEYIMALEYGHSKQAPAGMARVTVARWQAYIDGALRAGSQSSRLGEMRGGVIE